MRRNIYSAITLVGQNLILSQHPNMPSFEIKFEVKVN